MKAWCQKIVNLISIYCESGQVSQNLGQLSKNSCHLIVIHRQSQREFEYESVLSKVCSSPLPFSFPRRLAMHKSKIGILKNVARHTEFIFHIVTIFCLPLEHTEVLLTENLSIYYFHGEMSPPSNLSQPYTPLCTDGIRNIVLSPATSFFDPHLFLPCVKKFLAFFSLSYTLISNCSFPILVILQPASRRLAYLIG